MIDIQTMLDQMVGPLEKDGFKVSRNLTLSDGKIAAIAASRTQFSFKGLVILSQHILVQQVDNATISDAEALFDAGFRFAKKANRVPLFRGLQFGFMVIPVLVGSSPDASLVEAVSQCPKKRWALFEYPVVVDLSLNEATYFTGKALWGALFFSDMRSMAEKYIQGVLSDKIEARDS